MIVRCHFGAAVALALVLVSACAGDPVGRECDLGTTPPNPGEIVVASPSLDCVTRTCLGVPVTNPSPPKGFMTLPATTGLCTAECSTSDDCDRVPESPCISGFTCAIPTGLTAGPYCCKKLCVCKDYIVIPANGKIPLPDACDPTNAANDCCNLSGRINNPMYPVCKS